jgi:hypothetical protein
MREAEKMRKAGEKDVNKTICVSRGLSPFPLSILVHPNSICDTIRAWVSLGQLAQM